MDCDPMAVDIASGQWLDIYGVNLGLTRGLGETDELFRSRLKIYMQHGAVMPVFSMQEVHAEILRVVEERVQSFLLPAGVPRPEISVDVLWPSGPLPEPSTHVQNVWVPRMSKNAPTIKIDDYESAAKQLYLLSGRVPAGECAFSCPEDKCDCGAEKANTSHSDWCSTNNPPRLERTR